MVGVGAPGCRNPPQSRECLHRGLDQCMEPRLLQRPSKPGYNGAFPATGLLLHRHRIRDLYVCVWALPQPDAANSLATLADLQVFGSMAWRTGLLSIASAQHNR